MFIQELMKISFKRNGQKYSFISIRQWPFQIVNSDIYAIASQIKLQGTFKLHGSNKIIS